MGREMEMLSINKDRSQEMVMELEMENGKWKMEDANERGNNGNEKRDEMENLQAMLRLLSKSWLGVGNYAKV